MLFRKGLSKYLKNIVYKHSLAGKFIKNGCYMPHSYTLAPTRRDNSSKPTTTPKTIKDI